MKIALYVSASRSKMPWWFRKRVWFRNSKARWEMSGFANYERAWCLGWDVVLEWGFYDPTQPRSPKVRAVAAKGAKP